MNPQETAAVLAYFASAWPRFDMTEETVKVWIVECKDVNPDDGQRAMRQLVRTQDFPPPIAKFLEAAAVARQHRTTEAPALPPAPVNPVPPPPQARELAAKLRLQGSLGGGHWHGGPGPCPVCGGLPVPGVVTRPPVEIAKTRCSRCGENTLSHAATVAAVPPDPMRGYGPDLEDEAASA